MSRKKFSINKLYLNEFYLSENFKNKYHYTKKDLGVKLKKNSTTFKIWAPISTKVTLNIYKKGNGDNLLFSYNMNYNNLGIFKLVINRNLNGFYYTYSVENFGKIYEIVDPYAKSTGVNGKRGLIVDLNKTNPKQWNKDTYLRLKNNTDAIIYETHIRDFSMCENSGIYNKGKFLSFTEKNTKNDFGDSTGIDHLKDLGVTHVHLLPVFDFASIDESVANQYNWGYDPLNFNCLEGSYSTNAYDGFKRIREFKKLVQSLHRENIGVIMDVVYNHTYNSENSYLNKLLPNYFYRYNEDGTFSNGSGCGNEIDSEKFMVRKFIIDSLCYLTKEYHLDGFRFDLMGLLDIETMNQIYLNLKKINPNILIYGEPWKAGKSTLKDENSSIKINMKYLPENISYFSDDMRDSIKGHLEHKHLGGFISNMDNLEYKIKCSIVASTYNKQLNNLNFTSISPNQCINYESSHDDETFFDRLYLSNKNASLEDLLYLNKLGITLILTSQGIPFIHSGEEFLRSKRDENNNVVFNSYKSPDNINAINWNNKSIYKDLYNYYKGLINLRKNHSSFRMTSKEHIENHLKFIDSEYKNFVGYYIENYPYDSWKKIGVFFNPSNTDINLSLSHNKWVIVVNNLKAGTDNLGIIEKSQLTLPKKSHLILVDFNSYMNK